MNFLLTVLLLTISVLPTEDREPRQTMVCTDRVIDKSVLSIAPCSKHHAGLRIGIDDGMRPAWRYDDLVPGPAVTAKQRPGSSSALSCA